ncbi:MAG: extracellular solute-binding protein [Clostridia bacterium]|nr:extracellular solute-binding protein [Clostridia bacterium]
MKKLLSLLLALMMCAPAFLSCAETEETASQDPTSAVSAEQSSGETAPEETEVSRENIPDTLPDDLDFGGETVTFHLRGDDEAYQEVGVEEMTGEPVNDAIYERNEMISERLNVNLVAFQAEKWDQYNNAIASLRSSIMAADGAYDVIGGWSARIPSLSLEGLLRDLNELPYLDFDQPWWSQSAVEELQIAGKLHFITGDLSKTMLSAMCIFVFNQKVATDYDIENLYDVVREKRWTVDYVHSLVSDIYVDANGNGTVDTADIFGLTTSSVNDADGFMQGYHVSLISRDENGLPVLDVDTDRMTTVVEKTYELYWNNPGTWAITGDGTDLTPFREDRALLSTTRVSSLVSTLAEMESDFGVLPYPLLNEAQSDYGIRVQDALSLWCIPIDAKNPEMSAAVLEALCAQSYRTVTPAYFDVALKNRYSRDQETAEMMDLIKNSALINFEQLYNESIGNPWFVLRTLMPAKNSNYASYWATNSKVITKMLEKAVEKIQENG